ncbi:MAG: arginine--tRNA ligase [Clostridia bacterium]|nr:arginine--tRNA ligase [Clostridia bacterium]
MSKAVSIAKEQVFSAVKNAMQKAMDAGVLMNAEIPNFTVERPADRTHGDFATNAAMVSARAFRTAPQKIAAAILDNLDLEDTYFTKAEVAGPGFMNFFLSPTFYSDILFDVMNSDSKYGRSNYGQGRKVMVEFVSANPTGPMHMGNARGGALGDCLSAVMDAAGYDVWREFYVNDAGNQLDKFGLSLSIRYQQLFAEDAPELPEDSYHGEDILDLAKEYADAHGDELMHVSEEERRSALVGYGLPKNIAKMKADMEKYRVHYDCWYLESDLHKSGKVMGVVDYLRDRGLTYEKDGAVWYKATEFGGEKDEVLVRANGNPTYFTADIAYHKDKFDRGFDLLIDIWGSDHHGHVARMKGAMDAIGQSADKLDIVLMQFVRLMRDGEIVRMSKRTGKAIQLGDLLDEVPVDSARFLFNMREANSLLDFDLGLAVQQDSQNPVYYVQYAHARICSILRALEADGIKPRECTAEELTLLVADEEIDLIRHISEYTDEIIASAKDYDPVRITRYVIELATKFHKFYNACRVKGENESLMQARLTLCRATATVIRNVLTMFNINVPTSM